MFEIFILLATLAFATLLAWVAHKALMQSDLPYVEYAYNKETKLFKVTMCDNVLATDLPLDIVLTKYIDIRKARLYNKDYLCIRGSVKQLVRGSESTYIAHEYNGLALVIHCKLVG